LLAERDLPADLDRRIHALVARWRADRDIAAAYLFGSRARGQARPRSDVDFAIVLRENFEPGERYRKRLALIGEATEALGTDAVDLVLLEEVPSLLGHRVLRDGRLLLDSIPARRARIAERIFRAYFDEEPIRRELDRALARRLAEGTFAR
jgi:predicted nucleotidyltransferase